MTRRTVFSKIKIKAIIFFIKTKFVHAGQEFLIVVFSLTSSDDFPDTRNKTINCRNRLAVIILFHVKRFDFFRVICNKYRTLIHLLCQITFMLCLKITSPGNLILKLIVVLLQYLDRLCVSNTGEIRIRNIIQSLQKSFINERIKEIHLFRRVFKNIIDDIFQHRLCQIHVVFKICKRNLRFDHPKLCRMTGCV